MLARDEHRGCLGQVGGEDAGGRAGSIGHQKRQVETVGLDAGGHRRRPETEGGRDQRLTSAGLAAVAFAIGSRVNARTRSGRPKSRMKPAASLWS